MDSLSIVPVNSFKIGDIIYTYLCILLVKWLVVYLISDKDAIEVRLLRPGFEYPNRSFKHHDALYYPSEDAVFIVTKRRPSNYGANVYTEVAIWMPEEIQLLGTLALSIPEGGGRVTFAPWYRSSIPEIPITSNLASDDMLAACLESAIQLYASHKDENRSPYVLRETNRSDSDVEYNLFENIDPKDGLLLRGLYTLLKSQLLINSDLDFMEEAFMNLQISREAVFRIIRKHLQYIGNPKPSEQDVYDYIRLNFQMGEHLVKFLEEQYDSWLETKHPLSRFGAEWASSLMADDVLEPYDALISIYRHIVLDEPGRSSMLR